MIDSALIGKILKKREKIQKETGDNCIWLLEEIWDELLNALGDSEDEIIEFVSGLDIDAKKYILEISEELCGKFDSPQMDELIDTLSREITAIAKTQNIF